MRQLATLDQERHVPLLADYLLCRRIEVQVEREGANWVIWVRDEDRLAEARTVYAEFLADPTNPKYQAAVDQANRLRKDAEKQREEASRRQVDIRKQWDTGAVPRRRRPLVLATAIVCVLVFILTDGGSNESSITGDLSFAQILPDGRRPADGWMQIKQGEVWRLITPIFLHFGVVHLLFNLLALNYLGAMIESRRGTPYFGVMLLLLAVGSNMAEYWWSQSPAFGGISGVLFGFFGYAWMMTAYRPQDGIVLTRETVTMTMIFYLVCILSGTEALSGSLGRFLPGFANAAHTGGLLLGMAWGLIESRRRAA